MPKSFEIHFGLDLESDYKKAIESGKAVDEKLIKKIENFITDSKEKLEQNSKRKHNFNLNLTDKVAQNIKENTRSRF